LVAQRRQQLRVERREQEVGHDLGFGAGAQLAEQPADVTVPDGIGAGAQPRTRAGRLGGQQQIAMLQAQRQQRIEEGHEPLARRRAGPDRRVAAQHGVLQLALVLVEQGQEERSTIAETPEERGLPDARGPSHLLEADLLRALYITAGILLFPRIGAVVTVGLFIAGQMGASLLLDGLGWLGLESEALGPTTWAGAASTTAGAALVVGAQTGRGGLNRAGRVRRGWIALAVAAGAVLPVQGAINAQLRADLDAPVTTGAFSFLVATAAMLTLLAVLPGVAGPARSRAGALAAVPWWGWLGGLCGATYVTTVFVAIPHIGAAATVALTVAGQQVASVFVDRHGLLRLPRRPIPPRACSAWSSSSPAWS
jgi:uncharacterized membrane protein YdcZ (DUF606 family)